MFSEKLCLIQRIYGITIYLLADNSVGIAPIVAPPPLTATLAILLVLAYTTQGASRRANSQALL